MLKGVLGIGRLFHFTGGGRLAGYRRVVGRSPRLVGAFLPCCTAGGLISMIGCFAGDRTAEAGIYGASAASISLKVCNGQKRRRGKDDGCWKLDNITKDRTLSVMSFLGSFQPVASVNE